MAELATDTFTITKGEYDEILTRLGNLEILLETLDKEQQNAARATAANTVPDEATYKCIAPVPPSMEPHGYTFKAIHPLKWFAGMGAIECPYHPGQPNMVTCVDMQVQEQQQHEVLDPGIPVPRPLPPTVVQTGPSLAPAGSATLPPPPPALPATVVGAANNLAYEPPSPPPPLPVAAETSGAAATEPVPTPPATPETEANP